MNKILIISVIICLFACIDCGKTETPRPAATNGQVLQHTITDAEVGQKSVCPVMGTAVTVNKNTLSAEYKGKVYYFCCGACPGKFRENPDKYVK